MGILDQIKDLRTQIERLKARLCCFGTGGGDGGGSGGGDITIINNNPLANSVISGGIVTWLQDYDYQVSAAVYDIGGVQYTSPTTNITLAPADGTFDRIDVFALTTSGTAVALQGTASANPQEPNEDIDTQLPVSFAIVSTGTTEPIFTTSDENIYFENVEWTTSSNSAHIVANSTNNPFAGTLDVEGTSVASGNQIVFTAPSVPNYADYELLTFKIRSKAGWAKKRLQIQWLNGTTLMGNQVVFGEGSYGFISTNTTVYQTISIPLVAFGTIVGSNKLRIRRSGTGTIGFYLDNIKLTTTNVINNPPATNTLSRFGIEDRFGLQDRSVDMQEHSFVLNNSPYNGFYDSTPDALFEVNFPTLGSAIYLTSAENNIHAAGNNNLSGATNNLIGNANTIRSTGVNPNIFLEAIGSGSGAGKISIRAADGTPTTGAVLHTDFITNVDATNRDFQFPKASGTFALSVNGNLADSTGNITIAGGGGGSTRFGFAGEDATAGENRQADFVKLYQFKVKRTSGFDIQQVDSTENLMSHIYSPVANPGIAILESYDVTTDNIYCTYQTSAYSSQCMTKVDRDTAGVNHTTNFIVRDGDTKLEKYTSGSPQFTITSPTPANGDYYSPVSVNGVVATSAGNIPLVKTTDNYANDGAAATGGIPVGGLYHTSGTVKIRLT